MTELNQIEKDILRWVIDHTNDNALINQLLAAKIKERNWTQAGFDILLNVDKNLKKVDIEFPISGPQIVSSEIEHDGGSNIWGRGGYITALELYANGSYFNENVSQYKLMDLDTYNKRNSN